MMIFSVYNIKGGVGKTSTVVNLAYLASQQVKTLLCDLDPQGSASFFFRIRPQEKLSSKNMLKKSNRIDSYIKASDFDNLDVLPAHFSFRKLDIALDNKKHPKRRFRNVFGQFTQEYDVLFIDAPPNITLLSENILLLSDYVIVPIIPTSLSMLTFEKLQGFVRRKKLDSKKILPFFSMVDRRKKMHTETVRYSMYDTFLSSSIFYNAEIEKMALQREPLVHAAPSSEPARWYKALWQEICRRADFGT